MALILVSLLSPKDDKSALAILDPDSGIRYLQIDKGSSFVHKFQLRGMAVVDDLVYVTTPASLRIYRLLCQHKQAILQMRNEVILNEWLLGDRQQANLMGLTVSKEKNCIFVGNNNFCSIDELDLEGKFIQRRHLWEIAPAVFSLPSHASDNINYGIIRSLEYSVDGTQYITVANCNNRKTGKIINMDTGQEELGGLYNPHDGLFVDNHFYIHDEAVAEKTNDSSGVLSVYRYKKKEKRLSDVLEWSVKPEITQTFYKGSVQKMRGMAIADNVLFCGVRNFGMASGKQIPPRIVSFDATNGKQIKEYELPDLIELRQPRVFAMEKLPDQISMQWSQKLHFMLNEKHTIPEFHREEVEKVVEEEKRENDRIKNDEAHREEVVKAVAEEKKEISPVKKDDVRQKKLHDLENYINKAAEQESFLSVKEKKPSVTIEHVSLRYRRIASTFLTLKRNKHLRQSKEFLALHDLSLTLYEDETVGLIGRNGSGKSTLSMIISGALPPDSGRIKRYGKVHLLALGVGFRPEMTGRDNVFISGTLLGLSRREVADRMDEIKEFSELGDFFDEPLRTYSSGMRSRLGFAVSTAVKPDILILDEVMSTGDAAFRKKADKRMEAMRDDTKTVIIVSHNANQLKKTCSRVVWLEKGKLIMDGEAKSVLAKYNKFCQNPEKWLLRHKEQLFCLDN